MERSRSTPLPGLAAHRRRRGLTQRQLGELAGVAHTTVQRLESLRRGAYPQTLRKLAIALSVDPKDCYEDHYDSTRSGRHDLTSSARLLPTLLGLSTPHIGPHQQKPREISLL